MILLYILIALQLGDLVTTAIGFSKGYMEGNPFMSSLFKAIGVLPALILVKAIIIFIFIKYALIANPYMVYAVIAGTGWVFFSNLKLIMKP